jgi:hypothetical protein
MAIVEGLRRINGNPDRQQLRQVLSSPDFSADGATGKVEFEPSGDRKVSTNVGILVQVQPNPGSDLGYRFALPVVKGAIQEQLALQPELFRTAVNKAMFAAQLTQTAKTSDEWNTVAKQWLEAINLMKGVSKSSSNYETAQKKLKEYQLNLEYAKEKGG